MTASHIRAASIDKSEYEEIVHPNEEKSVLSETISRRPSYLLGNQPASWVNSAFVNWFINFDEYKLRPWLIRNYTLDNVNMQDQYDDALSRHQNRFKEGGDASMLKATSFMIEENSIYASTTMHPGNVLAKSEERYRQYSVAPVVVQGKLENNRVRNRHSSLVNKEDFRYKSGLLDSADGGKKDESKRM